MVKYLLHIVADLHISHIKQFRIIQEVLLQKLKVCQIIKEPAKYFFSFYLDLSNSFDIQEGNYVNQHEEFRFN